jgi:cystathionine beta-lyase/cystathionine gamma-synthase
MKGFSGIMSFKLKGGQPEIEKFLDALKVSIIKFFKRQFFIKFF